ncbi:PREDICTED: proline-rich protein 2-like [Lipotes vexillifer]|uniref:Proline-rich protein 2-like n=1 Tax=Lipotes vexillifer TaxID=118797 RepID=A0A340WW34_LIPVE|nr:PREDICTED: proline-rich protein 2-like [Lipotes vexillifer]
MCQTYRAHRTLWHQRGASGKGQHPACGVLQTPFQNQGPGGRHPAPARSAPGSDRRPRRPLRRPHPGSPPPFRPQQPPPQPSPGTGTVDGGARAPRKPAPGSGRAVRIPRIRGKTCGQDLAPQDRSAPVAASSAPGAQGPDGRPPPPTPRPPARHRALIAAPGGLSDAPTQAPLRHFAPSSLPHSPLLAQAPSTAGRGRPESPPRGAAGPFASPGSEERPAAKTSRPRTGPRRSPPPQRQGYPGDAHLSQGPAPTRLPPPRQTARVRGAGCEPLVAPETPPVAFAGAGS